MIPPGKIALSVIVRVVGGEAFARRCLNSLVAQIGTRRIEVIVPYGGNFNSVGRLEGEFPQFIFLYVDDGQHGRAVATATIAHELCDLQTSRALDIARGEIVAVIEDDATPAGDWCEQILQAHKLPYEVIGGAVEHAGRGAVNWAVYFLDFGRYQLPVSEGPVAYLTDVNVSYKRAALESVNKAWRRKYNEIAVHGALTKRGAVLWRTPQIVVYQDRGLLSFSRQLRERFAWGNLFAAVRVREMTMTRRVLYVVLSPLIPLVLTARMAKKVILSGRNRLRFVVSLPVFLSLGSVWCVGEFFAYLCGRAYFRRSQY